MQLQRVRTSRGWVWHGWKTEVVEEERMRYHNLKTGAPLKKPVREVTRTCMSKLITIKRRNHARRFMRKHLPQIHVHRSYSKGGR